MDQVIWKCGTFWRWNVSESLQNIGKAVAQKVHKIRHQYGLMNHNAVICDKGETVMGPLPSSVSISKPYFRSWFFVWWLCRGIIANMKDWKGFYEKRANNLIINALSTCELSEKSAETSSDIKSSTSAILSFRRNLRKDANPVKRGGQGR